MKTQKQIDELNGMTTDIPYGEERRNWQEHIENQINDLTIKGIEVGDGVTLVFYSDRHAATVIEVGSLNKNGYPKFLKVQRDKATRDDKNGMSDCQNYKFERDDNGRIENFILNKKGFYSNNGNSTTNGENGYGIYLWLNYRDEYFDYGF